MQYHNILLIIYNIPLLCLYVSYILTVGLIQYNVSRLQGASAPVDGMYAIKYLNEWTDPLPIDAAADEVNIYCVSLWLNASLYTCRFSWH